MCSAKGGGGLYHILKRKMRKIINEINSIINHVPFFSILRCRKKFYAVNVNTEVPRKNSRNGSLKDIKLTRKQNSRGKDDLNYFKKQINLDFSIILNFGSNFKGQK